MRSSTVPRTAVVSSWVRWALAVFLVLHAVAHLVGPQVAFAAYAEAGTVAYLLGAWEVAGVLLVVAGLSWALAALAFGVAAWLILNDHVRARGVLVAATSFSLLLVLLALPQAWIGVVVNLALLGVVWRWPMWAG